MRLNNLLLVFIALNVVSCQNSEKDLDYKGKARFSDSIAVKYKDNSLDIEYQERIFYKRELGEDMMRISQRIGESSYSIFIYNTYKGQIRSSMIHLPNDSAFNKMVSDMRFVMQNADKHLRYTFEDGTSVGTITAMTTGINLHVMFGGNREDVASMDIIPSEIDSIESCFLRYKNE